MAKRDSNGHLYDCPEHTQLANSDNLGLVHDSAFPCRCNKYADAQKRECLILTRIAEVAINNANQRGSILFHIIP